jgi:hypothetical protein
MKTFIGILGILCWVIGYNVDSFYCILWMAGGILCGIVYGGMESAERR